jgi:hypothetical protein
MSEAVPRPPPKPPWGARGQPYLYLVFAWLNAGTWTVTWLETKPLRSKKWSRFVCWILFLKMCDHTWRVIIIIFIPPPPQSATAPSGPGSPHYRGFSITLRHTTLGRTSLDGWSAQCRDLYLTTHNPHKRQTSMPPAGFEPVIPPSERPQSYVLDRAAAGTGTYPIIKRMNMPMEFWFGRPLLGSTQQQTRVWVCTGLSWFTM